MIQKFKKILAGAGLVTMTTFVAYNYSNAQDTNNSETKIVKESLQQLEWEDNFKDSPYLYQRYNGYIDRYIKDMKDQEKKVAQGSAKISSAQIAEIVRGRDAWIFENICGEKGTFVAHFAFDTKTEANGERRLIRNQDTYIECISADGWRGFFKFDCNHCPGNRRVCIPDNFGSEFVFSCHADNDVQEREEDKLSPILDWKKQEKPATPANKPNNKKVSMIQNKLFGKNR